MKKCRLGLITIGLLFIVLFFILTPSFFANHLTRDGKIDHRIYLTLILIVRIVFLLNGLFILYLAASNKLYTNFIEHLKRNWLNYLLLFISIVLSLIIIETGLYLLSPDELSNFYLVLKGNKTAEITYRNLEYNMSVKLNNQGFRSNKDFNTIKEDDSYRILVLGDSFAFGAGVNQNETFPHLLEKYFNQNTTTKFEVYNLGISGTPPYTYLRVLKKYGKQYNPDMVIISFFISNDIMRGNFQIEKLKFLTFPLIHKLVRQKLFGVDNLLNDPAFKNTKVDKKYVEYTKKGLLAPYVLLRTYYYPNVAQYYEMLFEAFIHGDYTKDILLEMNSLSNDLGAKFILMIIPEPFQVSRYGIEKQKAVGYIIDTDLTNNQKIQEAILNFTYENNINAFDMTPILKSSEMPPYYEIDLHWNSLGHELAANTLYNKIKPVIENE